MPSNENPSSECAWCGTSLSRAGEFHAVGATAREPDELTTEEGHMIGIELPERQNPVFALVPPPGSPAKEKEHDLWFNLCSEDCAETLRDHLQSDTNLVDRVEIAD